MRILVTGGSGFIGTNAVELLLAQPGHDVLNVDHGPPKNAAHAQHWRKCDILDAGRLAAIVAEFAPTHVVHLAARTGVGNLPPSVFAPNTTGTQNLIDACKAAGSVERIIFTSTLLVCRMGYTPKSDTEYCPSTPYGQSKVDMEILVRGQALPMSWVIIRPISIWGPWGDEPYINFFRSIIGGWYVHIGTGHYRRSLGYVGNAVQQILRMLSAPNEAVDRRTFYVADEHPADLFEMAEEIRRQADAPRIRRVPLALAKAGARIGDLAAGAGFARVPLTTFRLNNILTEYVFDMSPTIRVSGPPPFTLQQGIERTLAWMKREGA